MDGFLESFVSAGEDGSALSNSTTATSIIPAARKITLQAGFFDRVGKRLRIHAAGRISTAASTPGTLTFDVRLGSAVVFSGGASGTLATSASNLSWRLTMDLVCRAIGASASLIGTGELFSAALSATTPIMLLPTSAPAVGATFDSAMSQVLDLFATFSVASASNSLTLHQYMLESPT
jgi:hypothetical protein